MRASYYTVFALFSTVRAVLRNACPMGGCSSEAAGVGGRSGGRSPAGPVRSSHGPSYRPQTVQTCTSQEAAVEPGGLISTRRERRRYANQHLSTISMLQDDAVEAGRTGRLHTVAVVQLVGNSDASCNPFRQPMAANPVMPVRGHSVLDGMAGRAVCLAAGAIAGGHAISGEFLPGPWQRASDWRTQGRRPLLEKPRVPLSCTPILHTGRFLLLCDLDASPTTQRPLCARRRTYPPKKRTISIDDSESKQGLCMSSIETSSRPTLDWPALSGRAAARLISDRVECAPHFKLSQGELERPPLASL